MQRIWRQQYQFWPWLLRALISFLLIITIFSSFSYAVVDYNVKPGEIKKIIPKEWMSDCNRAYEEQVSTGRGPNEGYGVGIPKKDKYSDTVKFDGYDEKTGVLEDAKGFGYKVNKNGQWSAGKAGQAMRASAIDKMIRQKAAAVLAGKTVKWILAEEKYLKAFQEVLRVANAGDTISLEYRPPSDAVKEICKKKKSKSGNSSH